MDRCPHCDTDLLGEPIPEKYRHHNIPGEPFYNPNERTCEEQKASWAQWRPGEERCFCLPYGNATHFRREILVEISEIYDGGLFYQCPDCGGRWHRWPEGSSLRRQAEPYVNRTATEEM